MNNNDQFFSKTVIGHPAALFVLFFLVYLVFCLFWYVVILDCGFFGMWWIWYVVDFGMW